MVWPFSSKTSASKNIQARDPAETASLASTRFTFKLFRQLANDGNSANLSFSPASVMLCLFLVREGATGETQEAMDKVLEVAGLEPKELQLAIAALKSALEIEGPGLRMAGGNSLWCNQAWSLRPGFVKKARKDYSAEVEELDFASGEAVSRINSWISSKTNGKIAGILDKLRPDSPLVAVNAVYFEGLWAEAFLRTRTRVDAFHTSGGRELRLPFMHHVGSFACYEEEGFQAISLPYQAPRLAMFIYLPAKKSSLKEFQGNLNSAAWDRWRSRFTTELAHIQLPRFKIEYQANLEEILIKMGMGIAFDPQRADFETIHTPPPGIWLGQVRHRAYVAVNEEGTEAAAVTGLQTLGASRAAPRPRMVDMIVDRPFFFAIYDSSTKSILFMGSVETPRE